MDTTQVQADLGTPTLLPVIEDEAVVGEEEDPAVANAEDIDPSDWLSGEAVRQGFEPQHVLLDNGKRILMCALTDSEELRVREQSKKRDKATGQVRLNDSLYKRNFIATAINKAYGRQMGDPKFIIGDMLAQRPTGELNELLKAAFRISGMKIDRNQNGAQELFG